MKIRKAASFILCMFLVCMLTIPAFAADVKVAKNSRTGVEYTSIQAAVDKAQSGDTIVVTRSHKIDCSTGSLLQETANFDVLGVITASGKEVVIDLNGKNLTGHVDGSNDYFIIFASQGVGGHLHLKDSAGTGSVKITSDEDSIVYAMMSAFDGTEGSRLTVDGGSYVLDKAKDSLAYSAGDETLIVNGGNFHLDNLGKGPDGNGSPWIFNAKGRNDQHVLVYGGTFNANVDRQFWIHEVQLPTKAIRDNLNGTWTVVDAMAHIDNSFDKDYCTETLQGAIDAVVEDSADIIKLLEGCALDTTLQVNKNAKIDPNGQAIKWEGPLTSPMLTVAEDKTLTVTELTFVRDGYALQRIYSSTEPNYTFDGTSVAGGTSIFADWSPNKYEITWMNEGSVFHTTPEQIFDQKVSLPQGIPAKAAVNGVTYQFAGWYTQAEGGEKVTADTIYKIPQDTKFYARYVAQLPVAAQPHDVSVPHTGDSTPIGMLLMMAVLALGGMAMLGKRRHA